MPKPLVVLEEGQLTALANRADVLQEFKMFAALRAVLRQDAKKKPGCGSCNRSNQSRAEAFRQLKASIAGLSADRKRRLKELLDAAQARLLYRDGRGKTIQLTF